ncbi:unnamed protein product [Prorocentrum cordatum]|uniref:Uncharacterized protein n=1 Tax=Prorocentrum cordatum TaxID=2364126 RepID=A0ABN9UFJ5_9DINO|nr:unnamed protein product [Polarella glacialis]
MPKRHKASGPSEWLPRMMSGRKRGHPRGQIQTPSVADSRASASGSAGVRLHDREPVDRETPAVVVRPDGGSDVPLTLHSALKGIGSEANHGKLSREIPGPRDDKGRKHKKEKKSKKDKKHKTGRKDKKKRKHSDEAKDAEIRTDSMERLREALDLLATRLQAGAC